MQHSRKRTFEALEPRHALTAITATLNHGALLIDAHDTNNTVTLDRTATAVTVAETSQSFALSNIQSIEIDLHGQTDVVTLANPLKVGFGKGRIPLRVHSAGGDDQLIKSDGTHLYFGPDARIVTISNRGVVKLDGKSPNWLAYNIPDNDLGALLRQRAADGRLDRADMLAAFDLVEQQTTVGEEDFTTLRTVVARNSLFKHDRYVQSLANLVVNPSVANALYQNDPLGNLEPTSTGAHLTLLVDKWFLGMDHPDVTADHPDVTWLDVAGTLFNGPPDMHQIHQGADDDCFFLAAMESIAIHNPKVIEHMFIVNGDGTYTVRFYDGKQAVYLTIDSELPILPDGKFVYDDDDLSYNNPSNVLWSAFAEKAYAQLAELGWSRPDHPHNTYAAISIGDPKEVMEDLTGKTATDYLLTETTASAVVKDFRADKPVCFNSYTPSGAPDIVPDHIYALVAYNRRSGEFELFNPWGFHQSSRYPALIWVTWQEIVNAFHYVHVGGKV